MKNFIKILSSFIFVFGTIALHAQIVNIPDANFKSSLIAKGFDTNGDGEIQKSEALAVKTLTIDQNDEFGATDITGLEEFKNLEKLDLHGYAIEINNFNLNINFPLLKSLTLQYFENLANPIPSNFPNLEFLVINNCVIDSLVVSNYPLLKSVSLNENDIRNNLKIYDLPKIEEILGYNLYIKNIFISNLPLLTKLESLNEDNISDNITITQLPIIKTIDFGSIYPKKLDINNLEMLEGINIGEQNSYDELILHDLPSLNAFWIANNSIRNLRLINLTKLLEINIVQSNIDTININNLPLSNKVTITKNTINVLNISNLPKLENLECNDNQITNLAVIDIPNLTRLYASKNLIINLIINNSPKLTSIFIDENQLNDFNLSRFPELVQFNCSLNKLTSLDLSNNKKLQYLIISGNYWNKLVISDLPLLSSIDFVGINYYYDGIGNQINSLTLSNLPLLGVVYYPDNEELENLNLYKLNLGVPYFSKSEDPFRTNFANLKYICTDLDLIDKLKDINNPNSFPNTLISTCNSTTDGSFYKLNGQVRLDLDNNGCDEADIAYPYVKIKVTGSLDSGYIISGSDGNFSIYSKVDTVIFQPILDQTNYFLVSPEISSYILPDSLSPSFCITPNGVHNDLSVSIIPTRGARPGFSDATYKVVYKNQGTTTQNGSVTFNYDEAKMNFISASPIANNSSDGKVSFDFSGLAPFETSSAIITMRTNSPSDNPAVNSGDVLEFTAVINGSTDETPDDNLAILNQTVVGSLDPNDKTCLEGEIVSPELIGKNVHYLIRFENEGTANAENIVVTDYIDTTVFDINTLQITDASHICHTQISQGNKVQFIFSDIQLPFTDPNKHGHVAFSIKLKDKLVIGDSIQNKADIYFDYNLPVATNKAISEINYKTITYIGRNNTLQAALDIYPNPSNGQFSLDLKADINSKVQISILNVEGKVVFAREINHQQQSLLPLNLKGLAKGVYLIKAQIGNDVFSKKVVIQ
jgi:uncharacterized repeat protein (TIGR01451 family)